MHSHVGTNYQRMPRESLSDGSPTVGTQKKIVANIRYQTVIDIELVCDTKGLQVERQQIQALLHIIIRQFARRVVSQATFCSHL